jgi:predicted  nucleic acid-binding Zn-ribbon protein
MAEIDKLRQRISKLKAQQPTPKRAEAIRALQVKMMMAAWERMAAR